MLLRKTGGALSGSYLMHEKLAKMPLSCALLGKLETCQHAHTKGVLYQRELTKDQFKRKSLICKLRH
jgi:hypothetical protein